MTPSFLKKLLIETMTLNPSKVSEIIEKLQTLNPDLLVYARSKYSGDVEFFEDNPVNKNGITEMEDNILGKHVAILF